MRTVLAALLVAVATLFAPVAQADEPTMEEVDAYLFERYEWSVKWDRRDYTFKDPFIAVKMGRTLQGYVIGQMKSWFKVLLYKAGRAMDEVGIPMCLTAGHRGPERERLIDKDDKGHGVLHSYHGLGLAADVVACPEEGKDRYENNRLVWRWIDEHGRKYGLGRPYGNWDRPHVGPIAGREYADKTSIRLRSGTEIEPPRVTRVAKVKKHKTTRVAHNKKYKKRFKNGKTKKVRVAAR